MSAGLGVEPTSARAYLRREGMLSIVINAVLSLLFFLVVFGIDSTGAVHVGGFGGYAFDFLPQSFMVALMSALVPGMIAAARIRSGQIEGTPETIWALVARSLLTALVALAVGGTIAFVLTLLAENTAFPWLSALVVKIIYGAILAAIVTPDGLRAALRQTVFH
jgi:ABC-type phosphate/phosphonate transport system permease subunit